MSPQWLLYDGRPIADALVLSHTEQRDRLAATTPEALPTAVVAGDPCYDRILASVPLRETYRGALGVADGRRLVVVSSTWWKASLLGTWPDIFRRLVAELPIDSYQVAAVLHPNIWHGHGPWQVRTWLARCVRAGMILLPPEEGWRAALIAADCVIGDHGSVTCYGAALGGPVLLGAFPDEDVAPGSPVHALGGLAPRLARDAPLRAQVDRAIDDHDPRRYAAVADLVTSAPGESAALLRALCYDLLGLAEPPGEPPVPPLPTTGLPGGRPGSSANVVGVEVTGAVAAVTRFPAEPRQGHDVAPPPGAHLVVRAGHPGRRLLGSADVVVAAEDEVSGGVDRWLDAAAAGHPGALLVAVAGADGRCSVRTRDGTRWELTPSVDAPGLDPAVFASALHAALVSGTEPPSAMTVHCGPLAVHVAFRRR